MVKRKLSSVILAFIIATSIIPASHANAEPITTDTKANLYAVNIPTIDLNKYIIDYKELPVKTDIPKDKVWDITFDKEVDKLTMTGNTIKVLDVNGEEVNVTIRPTSNLKVWEVLPPTGGYTGGQTYALIVRKGIAGKENSLKLKQEISMKFVIATSTSEGSTGGTTQTTGTNRILSVDYKGTTLKNNNPFDTSKTYAAVTNNNILNKDKLLVNMSINGIQKMYYNVIADYQKSQNAFEKVDILEPIFMKEEDLNSYNLTVNFGTDIDSNSVVNGSTVYCIQKGVENDEGFGFTKGKRNILITGQRNNSIDISVGTTGDILISNHVNYLFINGITDKCGKILKPMIVPIYISYTNNRATITADNILQSKPGDTSWEWVSKIIGVNSTSLKLENDSILDWDRISGAVTSNFSNNQDIIKEVRNRISKYEIMYQDMYNTGIFPKDGLKPNSISQFKNKIYIWDRFILNGKNVDVVVQSSYNDLYINIYDRGSMWISNPNCIGDYGIPGNSNLDKAANWQYNFNKVTMDSWTYK